MGARVGDDDPAFCFALDDPVEAVGDESAYYGLDDWVTPLEEPVVLEPAYFGLDGPSTGQGAVVADLSYYGLDESTTRTPTKRTTSSPASAIGEKTRMPRGIVRHSKAWAEWLNRARWSQGTSEVAESVSRLADAWDSKVLRAGDTVDRSAVLECARPLQSTAWVHANTWRPEGLIKQAFRDIGPCGSSGSGNRSNTIDSTRRRLVALLSVAGVVKRLFSERANALLSRLIRREDTGTGAVYLRRHFDSTPACFAYGAMKDELENVGRHFEPYMYRDELTGHQHVRWRTVSASAFQRSHPKLEGPRGGGVLDVMALHGKLVTSSVGETEAGLTAWTSYQESAQALTYAPRILMKNNASSGMQALNTDSCFNLRALKGLADRGYYCIVDDCPDGCPTMHRLKRASAEYGDGCTRFLYNEYQTCVAHKLHNGIKDSFGESAIVGHAHAVSYVFALDSRRRQLVQAFKQIVHLEMECIEGRPPPEYVKHARAVLDATILRHKTYIAARGGQEGGDVLSSPVSELETHSLMHANGDLRVPRITHWCWGCCTDEAGQTTREMQERNMVACLRLLLGFLFTGQKPAINRWLSTGRLLGYVNCGFFFYNILPRTWRLAFGEGEVPSALADLSDWKVYCKSKVRRVCLWFSQEEASISVALYTFAAAPAEHLLQLIQSIDVGGSIMRDIAQTRTNLFWQCRSKYASMLLELLSSSVLVTQRSQCRVHALLAVLVTQRSHCRVHALLVILVSQRHTIILPELQQHHDSSHSAMMRLRCSSTICRGSGQLDT